MGVGGRSVAWAVWLLASSACGPKAAPEVAAEVPEGIDGTWWLTDGFDGPVQGRLEIDGRDMTLVPSRGAHPLSFSLHAEGREWEAIGDGGVVVRLDVRSPSGLLLYRADGRVGWVWRAEPLPAGLGGRWVAQDPATGRAGELSFIGGPVGEPARFTLDRTQSGEAWAVPRGDGGVDLIVDLGGRVRRDHLHELPGEVWLLIGQGAGAGTQVLYREGQRPRWLAVPAE